MRLSWVNFAFTYPYYAFDFFIEESILSDVIMLVVAVSTSTLNIRIRDQEKLRSENEKERMRGNLLPVRFHTEFSVQKIPICK